MDSPGVGLGAAREELTALQLIELHPVATRLDTIAG
jgi:hypothetical protein